MNNNLYKPSNPIAAIVVAVGVISGLLSLFCGDVRIASDYGLYIFAIIDVVYIASCIVMGVAMFNGKKSLLAIAAFVGAASTAVKTFKCFQWARNYSAAWDWIMLLGVICGLIGFILLGVMFLDNTGAKETSLKAPVLALLGVNAVIDLIYPFRYAAGNYYYSFGDFFKDWITNSIDLCSFFFLLCGTLLYIFLNKPAAVQAPQYQGTMQPQNPYLAQAQARMQQNPYAAPQAPVQPQNPYAAPQTPVQPQDPYAAPQFSGTMPQAPVVEPAPVQMPPQAAVDPQIQGGTDLSDQDRFELLKKYKALLDSNVISPEEFEAKKRELLK